MEAGLEANSGRLVSEERFQELLRVIDTLVDASEKYEKRLQHLEARNKELTRRAYSLSNYDCPEAYVEDLHMIFDE